MLTTPNAFTDEPEKRQSATTAPAQESDADLKMTEEFSDSSNQSGAESPEDVVSTEDASTPEVSPAPKTDGGVDDEESIEDYMARLMDRVASASYRTGLPQQKSKPRTQGRSSSKPITIPPPSTASEATGASIAAVEQDAEPSAPPSDRARTAAPEKSGDMSTMRAVANQSAHMAVDNHTRSQLVQSAYRKLVATIFFLVLACSLLVWPPRNISWTYPAAWALLAGAMWLFWWYNVSIGLLTEAWATDRRAIPPTHHNPAASQEDSSAPDVTQPETAV